MLKDIHQIKYYEKNTNNNNNNQDDLDADYGTEIAIVMDGSGSISAEDFQTAKDFISNMMKMFWEKCTECDFAVVQYGSIMQTEFSLKESREESNKTLQKVQQIKQVGLVTKTASALQYVMDNIFNEANGSIPQATKIILVLTDGDIFMDPLNLTTVIKSPAMQAIERFVIGVGEAFESPKALNELKLIASDGEKHLIKVGNYSALDGLLSSLQQKIIGIEGTKGDKLEFELAEIGFAVDVKDKHRLLFGAVGAFDWSGGLLLLKTSEHSPKVEFLSESKHNSKPANYGYLGYSVIMAQGKYSTLYIAGAPHHSNVGQVLVFEEDVTSYHLNQYLKGEQLGSYFGFELCTMDITSDGTTDILLVAAPFYHKRGEEGKVYVYKLDNLAKFTLDHTLQQHNYPFSRFGYSVANIGDINQDGFQDIAIGAPLEGHLEKPDSFGSVYIYNSHKDGIHTTPSQRITAAKLLPRMQYFGQSIDGGLDLTSDGYPDISVGALANVILLRSRPVIKMNVSAQFTPDKIPLKFTNEKIDGKVDAQVCFGISPFKASEMKKTSLIYSLDLDVDMEQKRITFANDDSGKGKLLLIDGNCARHKLIVKQCNYDCFSSIQINISYALIADLERDLPAPILDTYDPVHTLVELPYVKDCNNKPVCIPILSMTTVVSRTELVIGLTNDLAMNLTLTNAGDDSYMTSFLITYPKSLHVKMLKQQGHTSVTCSDDKAFLPILSSLNCNISYPVFKASTAELSIIWELNKLKFSKDKATINIEVNNINNVSRQLVETTALPVKHLLSALLSTPKSTFYVNPYQRQTPNEDVHQYTFHVNTENQYEADVTLSIEIPVKVKNIQISTIKNIHKTQNSTECKEEANSCISIPDTKGFSCSRIRCSIKAANEEITVTSQLFLSNKEKLVQDVKGFLVFGEILYNKTLFVNLKDIPEKIQISVKFIDEKDNTLPVIIGSTVGGVLLLIIIVVILFKCGFFKRKYRNIEEQVQ
uniref:VWFA domain-containing protein n=1 Tax=Leptobrachium leishanense TaxID=445787 RepID=A0A8C5QZP4_9ANUR